MESGSLASFRAALSGTGADIGGERDDEAEIGQLVPHPMGDKKMALIAVGPLASVVISTNSRFVLFDIEQIGQAADEVFYSQRKLIPQEPGLYLWEGNHRWIPGGYECPDDGEAITEGEFRKVNPSEVEALIAMRPEVVSRPPQ